MLPLKLCFAFTVVLVSDADVAVNAQSIAIAISITEFCAMREELRFQLAVLFKTLWAKCFMVSLSKEVDGEVEVKQNNFQIEKA